MKTYRLQNGTVGEIMFGVDNFTNDETLNKLNKGLSKIKPYTHCVPYYPKAKFSFISLNAFKYFLFGICKFDEEDIKHLQTLGFCVYELDLGVYSTGLSKLFCTYFDDEIVEFLKYDLDFLFANADSFKYRSINQPPVPKESIKEVKNQYYKDVKFKYNV